VNWVFSVEFFGDLPKMVNSLIDKALPNGIRLGRCLIFSFIFCVLPFFILILWYTFSTNEKMADKISINAVSVLQKQTDSKLSETFAAASALTASISQLASDDPEFFRGNKWAKYLLSNLHASHAVSSLDLGFEDGSFRSVKRINIGEFVFGRPVPDSTTYAVRWIDRQFNEPYKFHYVFYDQNNNEVGATSSDHLYIPKERTGYKDASMARNLIITDPEVHDSGTAKFSIAKPFFLQKDIVGVFAIDIELTTIDNFLSTQLIRNGAISLLVDKHGFILANSDKPRDSRIIDSKLSLSQVHTISSKLPSLALLQKPNNSQLPFFFKDDKTNVYIATISEVAAAKHKNWSILMVIPVMAVVGPLHDTNRKILLLGTFAVLLQITIIFFLARLISKPLERITREVQAIIRLDPSKSFKTHKIITEISSLANAIIKLKSTINAFILYVPRTLVNDLLSSGKDLEIGGESRYLTILFSDLKDFSALAEKTPSREFLQRVSSYLGLMTYAIKEEGGTLDKFIGDGVMAFWGAPLLDQHHAYHACVAAVKGKRRLVTLNEQLKSENKPPLSARIGIHSDAVLVGNIGSEERLSYTVVGDGVNIASRLEGINKEFGTAICISHSLFKEAGERLWVRPIDLISVKGRSGEFLIYELVAIRDGDDETLASVTEQELCNLTKDAYEHYAIGKYLLAKQIYQTMVDRLDDDLSKVMIKKCDLNLHPLTPTEK